MGDSSKWSVARLRGILVSTCLSFLNVTGMLHCWGYHWRFCVWDVHHNAFVAEAKWRAFLGGPLPSAPSLPPLSPPQPPKNPPTPPPWPTFAPPILAGGLRGVAISRPTG